MSLNPLTEIALTLHANTVHKFVESADPVARSNMSATFDELGVLLKLRDSTISVKNMWALLKFLESMGVDCSDMYLVSRQAKGREIIYTIGYRSKITTFQVVTEDSEEALSVGIVTHISKKGT